MIYYTGGNLGNVFRMRGSVILVAMRSAVPCAAFAALIRWLINMGHLAFMEADHSILTQTQAWSGFSVLVGFLIIFRSSQAYTRFWDGCTSLHQMRAALFNVCSSLISFTEGSRASKDEVACFRHTLVRLVSLMHNATLLDLEEMNNKWGAQSEVRADTYELLDPTGLDDESIDALHDSPEKVLLVFQWIQLLCEQAIRSGVLCTPAPIISSSYQQLSEVMRTFHECVQISDTPFPFAYAQNCELLLLLHGLLVPFVVSQWVTQPFWAFIFVFMQVFVLRSLNYIAVEIENPFGTDENDIDGYHMQRLMNRQLMLLLHPRTQRVPTISKDAVYSTTYHKELLWDKARARNFHDLWRHRKKRMQRAAAGAEETLQGPARPAEEGGESEPEAPWLGQEAREPAAPWLRQEARALGGSPSEPSMGADSFAIMIDEGKKCVRSGAADEGPHCHDACPRSDVSPMRWDHRNQKVAGGGWRPYRSAERRRSDSPTPASAQQPLGKPTSCARASSCEVCGAAQQPPGKPRSCARASSCEDGRMGRSKSEGYQRQREGYRSQHKGHRTV